MSWLSELTGIGINPLKGKVKIDPLKALGTVASIALPGAGGAIAKGVSAIPGVGTAIKAAGSLPGIKQIGNVLGIGGAGNGAIKTDLPPIYDDTGRLIPNPMNATAAANSGAGGGGTLDMILQALAASSGAYNTVKSNQMRGKGIDLARDQYNADAPLRAAGQAKLLSPLTPDLTSVYRNEQNPFARFRAVGG